MKVEINNLKKLKTLSESFEGEKGRGVTKEYIRILLKKHSIDPIVIDGVQFFDITKLPVEIKSKIKL